MIFSRLFIIITLIFSNYLGFSQERQTAEFGKPSESDFALNNYEKDSTAAAVVLFEQGYYSFEKVGNGIKLVKQVHTKIKVFDSKNFDGGTVDIPLYVTDEMSEKVTGYRALIHNVNSIIAVTKEAVFLTTIPSTGPVFRIVFPNVKDGSILEYAYRIESPFLFNFDGWDFQGEYPKIYSEFQFKIPLEFQFNNVLYGNLPLYLNRSQMINDCLQTKSNTQIIGCPITLYAMVDIPAFHEEDYMLSPKNYISRVEFEPKEYMGRAGWKRFSSRWKDVDKLFKKDNSGGKQLNKTGYFKKRLPDSIFSKTNELDKAKAVYSFIQNHYTWDGTYYSSETQVKDAYNNKKGSVPEINISLINALEAAGLDANLMLLSTRRNGLPTELYPVMTKFNYTIAVLTIANETYLLDATNKQAPFGVISFEALNVQGRVMDFKKGSYWMPIEPFKQNILYVNSQVAAQTDGSFSGKLDQASYGYIGLEKRSNIEEEGLDQYIKASQYEIGEIDIENHQIVDLGEIEKPLKESYNLTFEPETVGDKVILHPFFNRTYISENPFKLKERSYPLDFGFPFTNTYLVSIDLNDVYEIGQLPESRVIKLPGDDGECSVTYVAEGSKINIRFNMKLNAYRFQPLAHQSLKEFFGTMVRILKDEFIILIRK